MLTAQWAFHRVPVLHRIPLFSFRNRQMNRLLFPVDLLPQLCSL